jgi:hypothetical protein
MCGEVIQILEFLGERQSALKDEEAVFLKVRSKHWTKHSTKH